MGDPVLDHRGGRRARPDSDRVHTPWRESLARLLTGDVTHTLVSDSDVPVLVFPDADADADADES